jgi:8-oxo-dGTP diphosphatase
MKITRFNVRVYGVMINENNQVLVSDELIKKGAVKVTKFPGGGLDFGEGLRECLQREFIEETGVNVSIGEHLYTTDFFVPSAFDNDSQVIAVYYRVHCHEWQKIKTSEVKFNFNVEPGTEAECFRWVNLTRLKDEGDITLPTDVAVKQLLIDMK